MVTLRHGQDLRRLCIFIKQIGPTGEKTADEIALAHPDLMPPFKSQLAQVLSKAHEDGLQGAVRWFDPLLSGLLVGVRGVGLLIFPGGLDFAQFAGLPLFCLACTVGRSVGHS